MTFQYIDLNTITVNPDRQRQDISGIEELAESIRQNGLINPIVVDEQHVLIAGERRYRAHVYLGYDKIQAQYRKDLTPLQAEIIELEENFRRSDLTWQEETLAVFRLHRMKVQEDPEWTQEQTAEYLNISATDVSRKISVAHELEKGNEEIIEARKLSIAHQLVARQTERRKAAMLGDVAKTVSLNPATIMPQTSPVTAVQDSEVTLPADPALPAVPLNVEDKPSSTLRPVKVVEVIQGDFMQFGQTPLELPFTFLHLDLPYGVNIGDKKNSQINNDAYGGYADDADTYYRLVRHLNAIADNICTPKAHMMFWFSMNFYTETKALLEEGGWRVYPHPLIWHKSNNMGMMPDANREGRRTYETAFHCIRGDLPIRRATGNSVSAPMVKNYHTSEKPRPVLEHFFKMYVDEHTRMFDPTAGSGNAVSVASQMGAPVSLGLELNPQYALTANENIKKGLVQ